MSGGTSAAAGTSAAVASTSAAAASTAAAAGTAAAGTAASLSALQIASLAVSAVSGVISTVASVRQGQAQKSEANYVAAQDTQAASNAAASGQRALIEQNKETARVESNYAAGAAGSGGTTTDPTANSQTAIIGAEGNYRAATAMYEGQSKAQALTNEASASQLSGTIAQTAGINRAYGAATSGASSLFQKYGSFEDENSNLLTQSSG